MIFSEDLKNCLISGMFVLRMGINLCKRAVCFMDGIGERRKFLIYNIVPMALKTTLILFYHNFVPLGLLRFLNFAVLHFTLFFVITQRFQQVEIHREVTENHKDFNFRNCGFLKCCYFTLFF